jgi:hypothetical protein
MDLAAHQRKLLGLIRSTYQVCPDDDPYIRRVAQSRDLDEARRNIFLWRIYVLERTCVLTFTLLKRRDLLEEAVSAFITRHNISPFRETQGPAFLEMVSGHHDTLIASVAQFELALMKVRQGDPSSYTVSWNVEPHSILNSLAKDIPIDDPVPKGTFLPYFRSFAYRGCGELSFPKTCRAPMNSTTAHNELRCQSFVMMMQAAEFRKCDHTTPVRRMHDPRVRCVHR